MERRIPKWSMRFYGKCYQNGDTRLVRIGAVGMVSIIPLMIGCVKEPPTTYPLVANYLTCDIEYDQVIALCREVLSQLWRVSFLLEDRITGNIVSYPFIAQSGRKVSLSISIKAFHKKWMISTYANEKIHDQQANRWRAVPSDGGVERQFAIVLIEHSRNGCQYFEAM